MRSKKGLSFAISISIAAAMIYLILNKVGFSNIPTYFKDIGWSFILATLALYIMDMFIRAFRWQAILRDSDVHVGLWHVFLAYNLGNSLNVIIPAKLGDVARSYYMKKKFDYGYSKTLPATFLDRVFDLLGVYILLFICSIYVLARVRMESWFYYTLFLGVFVLAALFIAFEYALRNRQKLQAIKNDKLRALLYNLIDVFSGSIKNKSKFANLLLLSVLIWLCEGVITWLVFLAIHQTVNPVVAVFANMIANLTKVIPITPGGLGVFEGTMLLVFSLFGVNGSIAGMASTINHFLVNVYTLIIGIYVLLKENISVTQIQAEKVDKK